MRLPSGFVLAVTFFPLLANAQTFLDSTHFKAATIHSGVGLITVVSDGDGRLYAAEKRGRILVFEPEDPAAQGPGKFKAPTVFASLSDSSRPGDTVDFLDESGLLGLALDPNFAVNGHVYAFYTTTKDMRLVRLTADSTRLKALPDTPVVILAGLPRQTSTHKAGDIGFNPRDTLAIYLALGDDNDKDAARSQTRYEGKILRVSKLDGLGLPDNPYYAGDPATVRGRMWAIGFRNPFRFVFHPVIPDLMIISENGGPDGQKDREDRVIAVQGRGDCAWSTAAAAGGALSPWFRPEDERCKVLLTVPPVIVGLALTPAGPFLADAGDDAVLYLSYWGSGISRYKLSGGPPNLTALPLDGGKPFASTLHGVHMLFGEDGALYLTQSYVGLSVFDWMTSLRRIEYSGPVSPRRDPKDVLRGVANPRVTRESGGWSVRITQVGPYSLRVRGLDGRETGAWSGQGPASIFIPGAPGGQGLRVLDGMIAGRRFQGRLSYIYLGSPL